MIGNKTCLPFYMENVEGVIKPGDSDVVFKTYLNNKQYDFYLNRCKTSKYEAKICYAREHMYFSHDFELIACEEFRNRHGHLNGIIAPKATWVLESDDLFPKYHFYFRNGRYTGFSYIMSFMGWNYTSGKSINWRAVKKRNVVVYYDLNTFFKTLDEVFANLRNWEPKLINVIFNYYKQKEIDI